MPLTTVIPHSDCWADENKPNSNNPGTPRLRLRSTASSEGKRAFLFPALPFFPGAGARTLSAKLYVYAWGSWSGEHKITARRVTQQWAENKLTWARQPSVTNTNAAEVTVSNLSDGDEIEIDVSLMVADSAAGAVWYGLRLESAQDVPVRFYSSNHPDASLRPRLEVDWRPRLEAPTPLAPIGGQAVGIASPNIEWRSDQDTNENAQAHSRVQIHTSEDFTAPAYDSGKVANVEGQWSLAGEYVLTPSVTYYGRIKTWDDAGQESEWSDVFEFTYEPRGALTITSPPFQVDGYKELVKSLRPALYWPLDAEDGATDLSGRGHDGTGEGGVTIGGDASDPLDRGGTSTAFDGTNDRVASSYDPFSDSRTFAGWGYRDDTSGDMTLFGDVGFLSAQTSGDVMFSADDASEWDVFEAGLGTGAWFHWALVFDEAEDEAELFIDGESVGVVEHSAPWASGVFAVGAKSPPNTDPLKGKLAHVAVFERALTPEEIGWLADPQNSPAAGWVEDTSPPIVAQLEGATLSQWIVQVYRRIRKAGVPWRIEYAKGWVDGGPIAVTLPPNLIQSGELYRVRVEARDDVERAATSGDPSVYVAERLFHYQRAKAAGPEPVESLTVTPAGPKAVLTWKRALTPDEWCIRIDGKEVIQAVDVEETRVSADTYTLEVCRLRPGVEHEIEVEAVVNMGTPLAPFNRHSQGNPTQKVTLNTKGVWLVDPDDGLAVMFVGKGDGGRLEMRVREIAETHEPVRRLTPVRTTDIIGGLVGSYSGQIVRLGQEVGVERDRFEELKRRNKELRLIAGDVNIPVRLEEVSSLAPTDTPGHNLWDASFAFFQSGEVR